MAIAESIFDVLYLAFCIAAGTLMLSRARDDIAKLAGMATLVLGIGDAFHLVPRVLSAFVGTDLTGWLGVGKLVTSLTMTVFYVLLYLLWHQVYHVRRVRALDLSALVLTFARLVLCLLPQNGWQDNDSSLIWAIVRNVPFVALGALVCWLYFLRREEERTLSHVWLYLTLSFAFYLPVVVGAQALPALGMLMLPKTMCYVCVICALWGCANEHHDGLD